MRHVLLVDGNYLFFKPEASRSPQIQEADRAHPAKKILETPLRREPARSRQAAGVLQMDAVSRTARSPLPGSPDPHA